VLVALDTTQTWNGESLIVCQSTKKLLTKLFLNRVDPWGKKQKKGICGLSSSGSPLHLLASHRENDVDESAPDTIFSSCFGGLSIRMS
jgi:hypothetical protein